jgi:hypothetical protein
MHRSIAFVLFVACGRPPADPTPATSSASSAPSTTSSASSAGAPRFAFPTPATRGAAEAAAWAYFRTTLAPQLAVSGEPFERELLANAHVSVTLDSREMPGSDARVLRPIREPRIYFGRVDDVLPDRPYTQVRMTIRSTNPPAPADGGWVLLMVVGDGRVRLASQTCEGTC